MCLLRLIRLIICTVECVIVYRVGRFLLNILRAVYIYHVAPILGIGVDLKRYKRKWTVITGCTDGIGEAYLAALAEKGLKNFILISRNVNKLKATSSRLTSIHHACRVEIFPFTFGQDDYENLRCFLKQYDIGIVVNNVGDAPRMLRRFGVDYEMDKRVSVVNIEPAFEIIQAVLAHMMNEKQGIIVNVSSSQSIRPMPFLASYSASKAYISYLSESLHREYACDGIVVQCLAPLVVSTKLVYYDSAVPDMWKFLIVNPEKFARQAVSSLGVVSYTTGCFSHEIQMSFLYLLPWWILRPIITTMYKKLQARLLACQNGSHQPNVQTGVEGNERVISTEYSSLSTSSSSSPYSPISNPHNGFSYSPLEPRQNMSSERWREGTVHTLRYEASTTNEDGHEIVISMTQDGPNFLMNIPGSQLGLNRDLKLDHKKGFRVLEDAPGGGLLKKLSKPLFGGWWGKRYGLAPSPAITARRPSHIPGQELINTREQIKTRLADSGKLFEDPDFPCTDESIFFSRRPPKPFVWKRPPEIITDPQFVVQGYTRFDVRQGELGDCWFLAAVANLTMHQQLFEKIVPPNQGFESGYCGMFQFKFWQFGTWVDVIVDDRVPTYDGKLVFMHSTDKNEFWSALLEKAYAKLCGSYEAMKGGSTSEAMEDFTGGLTEMFDLRENPPPNLLTIITKASERGSLLAGALDADPNIFEAKLPSGLVRGHAYSITAVQMVDVNLPNGKSGSIPLLRLRNPWGNEVEWKGAWSDNSKEWTVLTPEQRQSMGLVFDADGEFWISFTDFVKNLEKLEICHLDPDTAALAQDVKATHRKWELQSFEGSWVRGATAGGCRNFLETFSYNPQFRITLKDPDEGDDEKACTCIVALLQKYSRRTRNVGAELLTIGFALYKIEEGMDLGRQLPKEFFRSHASVARSQAFVNLREVCCRFKLPPGTYVIVPSTFEPNQEGEFMLRVFSEKKCDMHDVDCRTDFKQPQPAVPTPATPEEERADMDKFADIFRNVSGEDILLDAWELQEILTAVFKKEFKFDTISIDTCRSMIAVNDLGRIGKLGVEEFKELWASVKLWKAAFRKRDRQNTGYISSFEMRDALEEAGYSVPRRVLKALVLRYASKDGTVRFDDFIACAVKLKTMFDIYNERDPTRKGEASFDLDAWLELTMYA